MDIYLYPDMYTFLISIGSNKNRVENIRQTRALLCEVYPDIIFSDLIETEPVGEVYKSKFHNQLAVFDTSDSEETVVEHLKRIEKKIGRLDDDKSKGIVKVDLDVLAVDTQVRSEDIFSRYYLKTLLQGFDVDLSKHLAHTGYFENT